MKQKTKQAARKRFQLSAGGKVLRRVSRQAHFNARASGRQTRRKHHAALVTKADQDRIAELLPYG